MSPAVLSAAMEVMNDTPNGDVLETVKVFFRSKAVVTPDGLESLPMIWLTTLPKVLWQTRKPHWDALPYMIRKIKMEDGALCLKFAQELPTFEQRITAWDRLRVEINLSLKPNLWNSLKPDVERMIWERRPDLRSQLFETF